MISTLDDLRVWARAVVTGTANQTSSPMEFGYGLGLLNLAGWVGHSGTVPGYQTIAVYLPEKQLTLVILTNTDISYQGTDLSTMLATAITKIVSPQHVYAINPLPQQSDPSPPPSFNKPGCGRQTMALSLAADLLSLRRAPGVPQSALTTSNRSRSVRVIPCATTSLQALATTPAGVRHDQHWPGYSASSWIQRGRTGERQDHEYWPRTIYATDRNT